MAGEMSAISSRKSVPPLARSMCPGRAEPAPVKAFFSWPKSSLSRSVSGKALQWRVMNGDSRRGPLVWMTRAVNVLPVPVGPVMRTGASEEQA